MKRLAGAALVLMALFGLPGAAVAAQSDTHVQLLAINDLHGHLAPNTPGTIQVGCCNPVFSGGVQTGWTQKTVPAAASPTWRRTSRRCAPATRGTPSPWAPGT
jgi:2',3'-cyclic-nucleotide 2'-phosphodiesterase (5'-nucleotidase family)